MSQKFCIRAKNLAVCLLVWLTVLGLSPYAQAYSGKVVHTKSGLDIKLPAGWTLEDNRPTVARMQSKTSYIDIYRLGHEPIQQRIEQDKRDGARVLRTTKLSFPRLSGVQVDYDTRMCGGGDAPSWTITRILKTPEGQTYMANAWGNALDEASILTKDANYRFLSQILSTIKP